MPRYTVSCSLVFDSNSNSLNDQFAAAHLLADTLEKTGIHRVELILGDDYMPEEEEEQLT